MTDNVEGLRRLRRDALHMLALVSAFVIFFGVSKHSPAWSHVNPFAEDPADAVASIAIQAAAFLAVLSCIRAFRERTASVTTDELALAERSNLLCAGSVLLTYATDGVAMARHASMWQESAAGQALCAVLAVLFLWGTLALWQVWQTTTKLLLHAQHAPWRWLIVVVAGTMATIALYPDRWRQGMAGTLLTAALGGPLLLVPMRVLAMAVRPVDGRVPGADALDDLSAFCAGMLERVHLRSTGGLHRAILRVMNLAAAWTRRYWWSFILAAGIAIGAFLASRELADDQSASSRIALVASVYIGLESAAVFLGAWLLSRPLELCRPRTVAAGR